VSIDEALANAVRLLQFAEAEADLAKLESYARLADSWISVGQLIHDHEMDG